METFSLMKRVEGEGAGNNPPAGDSVPFNRVSKHLLKSLPSEQPGTLVQICSKVFV